MRPPKPPPAPTDIDWTTHVTALAKSGQSVLAYARAHGLKPDTLYKRRRRLQKRAPQRTRLLPITVEAAAPCELVFPDGRVLRFPSSLDAVTLRAWVTALAAR